MDLLRNDVIKGGSMTQFFGTTIYFVNPTRLPFLSEKTVALVIVESHKIKMDAIVWGLCMEGLWRG